jgi:hypothetical protein
LSTEQTTRQSHLVSKQSLWKQCQAVVEGQIFCYLLETDPAENVENDDTESELPAALPCITSPTAIMPKSCIICSVVASQDLQLVCCGQCQSAVYCS